MPPQSGIGRLCNFLQGFLDLVLAEVELPGVGGGADGVDGMGLGDGDQPDVVRRAARRGRPRPRCARELRASRSGMCSYTRLVLNS